MDVTLTEPNHKKPMNGHASMYDRATIGNEHDGSLKTNE